MTTKIIAVAMAGLFLQTSLALPEIMMLTNGDVLEGALIRFEDNQFWVSQKNGEIRKVPRQEIATIDFRLSAPSLSAKEKSSTEEAPKNFLTTLSKPASKFETPILTFLAWKKAAMVGDIDTMVECYALFRQNAVRKQLQNIPKAKREEMKQMTAQTEFLPAEPFYQGDRAVLEVTWRLGLSSETQALRFLLEKSDWKLIQ